MSSISEKNNNLEGYPDNDKEIPNLRDEFEAFIRWQREHKNFVELKNHLDTRAELADLKESLWSLWKKSFENQKQSWSPRRNWETSWIRDHTAFTDRIYTRVVWDQGKNIFHWAIESVTLPFIAIKDGVFDLAKFISSPVQETKRTLAYLKSESPAKIL